MFDKKATLALAAACIMFGGAAAQAQPLTTIGTIPAKAMSATQMKSVEGKQHIYFLVEFRGVELGAQAELATRAAAPTPMGGDFRRSPSREATAFDFLNK